MNTSTMAALSRSYTAGILGVEGHVITVEAEVGRGVSCLNIQDLDIDPRESIRIEAVAIAEQLRRLPSMLSAIAYAYLVIAA